MKIYESEKDISEKILANKVTSFSVPVKIIEPKPELFAASISQIDNSSLKKAIAKVAEHPDLMYGSAILASTNTNRNDDVFLPQYTWEVVGTPVNTPFNDNHEKTNIIGHIIASRALDEKGNLIPDDLETAPDFFDIETDFVVYKDIYPDIADNIVKGAADNKKFVSMEAKLNDFDFGLVDPQNQEMDIVARNEKTAFLTKHLRIYGGDGEFQGKKLVRILKDFRFSGMGNVDEPANYRSKYTKINNLDGIKEYTKAFLYITKGKVMKIENLDQANALISNLNTELETLKADLKKNETSELEKITKELTTANSKVELAEAKIKELEVTITQSNTELTSVKADLQKKSDDLKKINDEAKLVARVNQLKEYNVELNDEKKTKYSNMTDEAFAEIIEFAKSIAKKDKEDKNDDEDKEEKDEMDKEKKKKDKEEAEKKAKAELDKAQENKDTDLNAAASNDSQNSLQEVAKKLVAAVVKTKKTKD